MREYIGEDGIPVVEYELEDIPKLKSGELPSVFGLWNTAPKSEGGGSTLFKFSGEAQAFLDEEKEAEKLTYWRMIDARLEAKVNSFCSVIRKTPSPTATIADMIRKTKWMLEPDSDPNAPKELLLKTNHLKAAWIALKRGERKFTDWHYLQVMADTEAKFLDWLKDLQANSDRIVSTKDGNKILSEFEQREIECHQRIMRATACRDIVRYFKSGEVEVHLFRNGNAYFEQQVAEDLAELQAAITGTGSIPTGHRTTMQINAQFIGEADPTELSNLLQAKFEDYGRSMGIKTLKVFASSEVKQVQKLPLWSELHKQFPIAEQWVQYLERIAEDATDIGGQAFAFSADGKQIEKPVLQTIIEYFNTKGAEVQLFIKGNKHALLILETNALLSFETNASEIYSDAHDVADPVELQTLFDAKFSEALDSGRRTNEKAFAKAEAYRLGKEWANYLDRLPIVGDWIEHLKGISEGTGSTKPDAPTATMSEQKTDGTGVENEPELTDARESVVNILDPLQNQFVGQAAFEKVVESLCEYFDSEKPKNNPQKVMVRKGNIRKLGQALGNVHRDIRHKDGITREYLEFAIKMFDCYEGQDISNPKVNETNLYKYMTEKK